MEQGNDYGVDYIASVFDQSGSAAGRFNVQVKYLALEDSRFLPSLPECGDFEAEFDVISLDTLKAARHNLSMRHLSRYLNPQFTSDPTLFILANERYLFYFWVNDVFEFYFQWLPRRENGHCSWWTANVRSIREGDRFAPASCLALITRANYDNEFGAWCRPATVDSWNNVALSMYLKHVQRPASSLSRFDVGGFWHRLNYEDADRDSRIFVFSHFLGLLRPTDEMVKWATRTFADFDSQALLPPAIRILSSHESDSSATLVIEKLSERVKDLSWWTEYCHLGNRDGVREFTELDWKRVNFGYIGAIGEFLKRNIERKNESAQQVLVDLMFHWNYSIGANLFALKLKSMARHGKLLKGRSLEFLKEGVQIRNHMASAVLVDAIESWSYSRVLEHRSRK